MAVNRYYSSTAQQATLTNSVNSSATVLPVSGTTGFPVLFPYTLILDRATISEEVVEVTSAVGNNLTVTRGVDSTSAVSHSLGATVEHGVSARDHREAQEHIAAATGVHGLAGALVGTTDTQTLTNKTLTAPTINGGTFSGQPTMADFTNAQHDHGDADDGGNIPQASVTGLATALSDLADADTALDGRLDTAEADIAGNAATITSHTATLADHEARLDIHDSPAVFILRAGTDQSIPHNTVTAVAFNTEITDPKSGHSTTVNNSRYTVPVGWGGTWRLSATVPFTANAAAAKYEVSFLKNGATEYAGDSMEKSTASITPVINATRSLLLVEGDYVEVGAFQNSGSSRSIDSGFKQGASFEGEWIRATS